MTAEVRDEASWVGGVERDQYLVFSLQSREYGIQVIKVQEITSVPAVTEVPDTPPYIEGIMNLRGRLASVINARKKFNLEDKAYDEDTRIVMVEYEGRPTGLLVDSVEEVTRIPDDMVQQVPDTTNTSSVAKCIMGIGVLGERLVVLLDIAELLSTTELVDTESIREALGHTQVDVLEQRDSAVDPALSEPVQVEGDEVGKGVSGVTGKPGEKAPTKSSGGHRPADGQKQKKKQQQSKKKKEDG